MAKIAFFDLESWERAYFKRALARHELIFFSEPLTSLNVGRARDCAAIAGFIYSRVDKKILAALPKLKLVTTLSTGFDHVDVKACAKRGVTVCNVPAYGDNTVAEHTFALILAASRKLIPSVERTRRGDFTLEGLRGFDLKGKTIGIVGTGKIGACVAQIAHGFQMKIIAFDVRKNHALSREFGVKYASLPELLSSSDIVTLHAPLNDSTRHMLNRRNINRLKKGAVLINTARGGLVETRALLEALLSGRVSFAGLDVLEEEKSIKEEKELVTRTFQKTCDLSTMLQNHILLNRPNVIVTPHNAFNSQEALERILQTTAQNIEAFFAGKTQNRVL